FDGCLCATDLPGENVFEVEDVEGRARRLLRGCWQSDRVNALFFPVSDEQDVLRSGGKAGYRLDVRRGRVRGSTYTAGNSDEKETHNNSNSRDGGRSNRKRLDHPFSRAATQRETH